MALSDAKILDAQAGAETFASALLAALAGVNSVSGPGMLDFLLVFSLPKLVFDDEVCGQVRHFVRDVRPVDDLPIDGLLAQLRADQHLIMAEHTSAHWPSELYLPSRIWERDNRENWVKAGSPDTAARATAEVDRRLAAYQPVETDPLAVAELERIIRSGLRDQVALPFVPPAAAPVALTEAGDARRRNRRRGG
jgi:trimethylamine--corrinoid protein Co-methyltransferase